MAEVLAERKLHTPSFTPEMLREVEARFSRKPRVTTVVLGETLRSLSRNGLRISYDPDFIIPEGEISQLYPQVRTDVLYFDGLWNDSYVPYFSPEEEDKIYSFHNWTSVGERERRNVQSIINEFSKIPGVNIGVSPAEVALQMYKDPQVRESIQNHRIWTANLYQSDRIDFHSRVVFRDSPDWLRHVVVHFNKDGINLSSLPNEERETAGIFVVGLPEAVDMSRFKLSLVTSQ